MNKTINQIFKEFLAEQKEKLAPRTFSYYEDATGWMERCFNGYGHLSLSEEHGKEFDKAYDKGIEFCDLFGPAVLDFSLFSEFIGYFLPKKIIIGYDTAKKTCGACLNFYKWLCSEGLIKDEDMQETLRELRRQFNEYLEEFNKPLYERR